MSTFRTAAPVIPFRESRTCQSLQETLHAKRRARSFYLDAARTLEANGLQVVAHAFRFTAAQEQEHAAILQGLLTSCGGEFPTDTDSPPLPCTAMEMLQTAAKTEHALWDERCPCYAGIAKDEGYPRIASALCRISETDRLHAQRFVQYMEALANDYLFRDAQRVSWVCLSCGHFHTGCEPPAHCINCSGVQGHFIRSSFYPFSVEE